MSQEVLGLVAEFGGALVIGAARAVELHCEQAHVSVRQQAADVQEVRHPRAVEPGAVHVVLGDAQDGAEGLAVEQEDALVAHAHLGAVRIPRIAHPVAATLAQQSQREFMHLAEGPTPAYATAKKLMNQAAGGLIKKWCESKGVAVHTSTRVESIEKSEATRQSILKKAFEGKL